ncbi:unnamed protein product [Arabis nemorensis]|uniref:Uncharacterized protein n=1 Tax=Arabis nemorensis TaxID=586526 RepID=A0A565CGV0_9BRAS|nr:unnamed protein product [Arabis nemorensis]
MHKKKKDDYRISIHVDLVIEMLSRLPVKTLLRLKCLSKEFSRIIQSQNFVDSCLSCSSSSDRSRLLFYFNCHDLKKLVFFSTPHRSSTCSISPTRYEMTVHARVDLSLRSPPIRGLIFYTIGPNEHVICNPATRQHLNLPENKILWKYDDSIEFLIFGYDPIFYQYKVLCMLGLHDPIQYQTWWVFTVGQDGNLWRKIQGMPSHLRPVTCHHVCGQSGICINGFLYFRAYSRTPGIGPYNMTVHVVSFDLNSEKFSLVEDNSHLSWFTKLIDFQGKLGFVSRVKDCEIEFSCLMENKEWASMVFHLPWAPVYKSHCHKISNSVVGICEVSSLYVAPRHASDRIRITLWEDKRWAHQNQSWIFSIRFGCLAMEVLAFSDLLVAVDFLTVPKLIKMGALCRRRICLEQNRRP